jgi:hypothetical protein
MAGRVPYSRTEPTGSMADIFQVFAVGLQQVAQWDGLMRPAQLGPPSKLA